MITIDEKAFPIVVARAEGQITLEDVRSYTQILQSFFAQNRPFGAIGISPQHTISSREARLLQSQWMKAHKATIGSVCVGFAWVLQSQVQLLLYKPLLTLQGKRIMGCSTSAFGDFESLATWIQAQLAIYMA